MAQQRSGCRECARLVADEDLRDHDGDRRLQAIENERQRCEPLASGAQHIGRADIARADVADVALPEKPGKNQSERDRPKQIAEAEGEDHLTGHGAVVANRNVGATCGCAVAAPQSRSWTRALRSFSLIPALADCQCSIRRASCFPTQQSSMRPTVPPFLTVS